MALDCEEDVTDDRQGLEEEFMTIERIGMSDALTLVTSGEIVDANHYRLIISPSVSQWKIILVLKIQRYLTSCYGCESRKGGQTQPLLRTSGI